MNIFTTIIITCVLLYYIDKYVPSCTEQKIDYRYIPRTLSHQVNDASESTNDMIRSIIYI